MLMRTMRRTLLVFVLLAAAAVALEPVIHTHPLTRDASAMQCALCVNANASVTTLKPVPLSPLVVLGVVATVPVTSQAPSLQTRLASRAPPAA